MCLSTTVLSAVGEIGQRRLMFIFRESKVCLLVYDPLEIYFSLDNGGTPERGPVLIPLLPYHVPHYSQLQPVLRVGGGIFFQFIRSCIVQKEEEGRQLKQLGLGTRSTVQQPPLQTSLKFKYPRREQLKGTYSLNI